MQTEAAATWRTYLNELVRRKSAREKAQLYETVGVTRTAFQRWRNGDNTPDAAHLHRLLEALTDEERDYLRALMVADPDLRPLLPTNLPFPTGQTPEKIPQEVYEEVLYLARDTTERFWVLCRSILLHALSQVETHPHHTGIELTVACCMPPRADDKIRSLYSRVSRGTAPWRADVHTTNAFFGVESLAGYAAMQRHSLLVPDRHDETNMLPVQWGEHEQSCAAVPMVREGAIAGVLLVSCAVANFFTPEKLTLLEKYAMLLCLAFYDQEFYPVHLLDLAVLPAREQQKPLLSTFRQRVQHAVQEDHAMHALTQVEAQVRVELEGELLHWTAPVETSNCV